MLLHTIKTNVIDGDPEIGYAVFGGYATYPYAVFFEGPQGSRTAAKQRAERFLKDNHPVNLIIVKVQVDADGMTLITDE